MAEANPKTSAVIITSPYRLTDDQVARIKAAVERGVPPDVGVVVLGGLKVDVVGAAPVTVDMEPGDFVADDTQAQILAELKALRALFDQLSAGGNALLTTSV